MDPKQTLKDILLSAQRIGQDITKAELTLEIAALQYNVEALSEWLEKGGYKPDYTVYFESWDD